MSFSASWTISVLVQHRHGVKAGYRCYENLQSSCRSGSISRGGNGRQAKKSGLKGVHVPPLSRYLLYG
jgi:hypothetical protein